VGLQPHSLLSYRYRDAANYKAHGAVLLSGEATSDHHRRLRESLIDGEYFIPERVGILSLREQLYGDTGAGATRDDHLLHELVDLRPATRHEIASMTPVAGVEEFVMRFEGKKRDGMGWWDGVGHGVGLHGSWE
jgi:hypothetical protein